MLLLLLLLLLLLFFLLDSGLESVEEPLGILEIVLVIVVVVVTDVAVDDLGRPWQC